MVVWLSMTPQLVLTSSDPRIGKGLRMDLKIPRRREQMICNHLVYDVHSRKLTWHPKIDTWKRRFLLETIILRFHVSFRECILFSPLYFNIFDFADRI